MCHDPSATTMLRTASNDHLHELICLQTCTERLEKLTEKKNCKRKRIIEAEESLFSAIDSAVNAFEHLFDSEKSFGGSGCPSDWEKICERRDQVESVFKRAIQSLVKAAMVRLGRISIPTYSFTLVADLIRVWIGTLNLRITMPRCCQYMLLLMG